MLECKVEDSSRRQALASMALRVATICHILQGPIPNLFMEVTVPLYHDYSALPRTERQI